MTMLPPLAFLHFPCGSNISHIFIMINKQENSDNVFLLVHKRAYVMVWTDVVFNTRIQANSSQLSTINW